MRSIKNFFAVSKLNPSSLRLDSLILSFNALGIESLKEDSQRSSLTEKIVVDEKSDSLSLINSLAILIHFWLSSKMLSMLSIKKIKC